MPLGNVTGIGWRADAARRDGVVHARVLAALSTSLYVDAAGEVLWIGEREATPHARAIHVAARAARRAAPRRSASAASAVAGPSAGRQATRPPGTATLTRAPTSQLSGIAAT